MSGRDEPSTTTLETLLWRSAEAVLVTRPDGTVLRANPAACAMLGRSEAEVCALGRDGLVLPGPEVDAFLAARRATDRARGEGRFRRADGSVFPVEVSSISMNEGADELSLLILRDLSEQRRLERELKESEALFRVAFHTLPDAVTLTEQATGRFQRVNEGAALVTGWPEAEMIGKTSDELGLWSDDDRAEFARRVRRDGGLRDYATRLRRKDGSTIDVVISARPLVVDGRSLFLTVTRDVSAQLAAERARDELRSQLRESQKMEAIGQLAGGVAHDFNNLLTVILVCTEILAEEQRGVEEFAEIKGAAQRAADLTRQLLAFARRQVMTPRSIDLNALVQRSEKLLGRVIGEGVKLRVDVEPELPNISADPTQIEQVVMNLAVNARDALPSGGTLIVETRHVRLDEVGVAPFLGASPGPYVRLAVIDDGTGMPRSVQERAFEPFYTTKGPGKGSGLGLATVHGIVTQCGGFIRIESAEGKGTRIEMIFPSASEPALPPLDTSAVASRLVGTETILLVEDEPQVRSAVARTLRKAGYRVLVAGTVQAALETAAGPERIDAVISDVVMPDANGPALVLELRRVRPGLRALLISGYPNDVIGPLGSDLPLLGKPFTPTQLFERLRALLDAPR